MVPMQKCVVNNFDRIAQQGQLCTVNNYSPLQSLYRQMLCFLFVPAFDYKIYCLMLYHLLKSTLHLKANACSIGTFIRFYMQSSLHSKANACNIGTFIRFYIQMRVQIKNKAFAYRFYRPFTQQCKLKLPLHSLGRRGSKKPQNLLT